MKTKDIKDGVIRNGIIIPSPEDRKRMQRERWEELRRQHLENVKNGGAILLRSDESVIQMDKEHTPIRSDKEMMHKSICGEIMQLYRTKNSDYGDSFSEGRKVIPGYTASKFYDKFKRFLNLSQGADRKVMDETIEDTLMDLANYAIMEILERRTDAESGLGELFNGQMEEFIKENPPKKSDDIICRACHGKGYNDKLYADGKWRKDHCDLCDGTGRLNP